MSCCALGTTVKPHELKTLYSISEGFYFFKKGKVIRLSSSWRFRDHFGALAMRFGFGRKKYRIPAGLYAINDPDENDPVLVTANYKLTVDIVRRAIGGLDVFLLVLDTKGINVWCAAGKGTFGTDELVGRITTTDLATKVGHRTIVVPQLGATGVNAREVEKRTGFKVKWGPVRIEDAALYLSNGMKASASMREVTFTVKERLAVTPVELIQSWKVALPIIALSGLICLIKFGTFSNAIIGMSALLVGAVLVGAGLFPLLLPYLPGRSFVFKGLVLGTVYAAAFTFIKGFSPTELLWAVLMSASITGFAALNFTGATTFTSVSGVKREIAFGTPILALFFAAGCVFSIILQTGG